MAYDLLIKIKYVIVFSKNINKIKIKFYNIFKYIIVIIQILYTTYLS